MDRFKYWFILSLIFNENFQVCPAIGYDTQRIRAEWDMEVQFYNCSKPLINDVFDWSTTWTGVWAKVLDDCEFSDGNRFQLWERELLEDTENEIAYVGTFDPKSAGLCYGGTTSTATTTAGDQFMMERYMKMAIKSLSDYILEDESPVKDFRFDE